MNSIRTSTGTIAIDERSHSIEGAQGPVCLTPQEYNLLSCLAAHAGAPVSRPDLLRDAWHWECANELKTKTVDMHVRRLRVKLEQAGIDPTAISTVRGFGYALNA